MLDFELTLTKADTDKALVYTLIHRLDDFLSGQNYRERRVGHGVATLEPTDSASESIGKIKSTLVKISGSSLDTEMLTDALKEHGYQFGFDKRSNIFESRVIINTPRGVLTFPLFPG